MRPTVSKQRQLTPPNAWRLTHQLYVKTCICFETKGPLERPGKAYAAFQGSCLNLSESNIPELGNIHFRDPSIIKGLRPN